MSKITDIAGEFRVVEPPSPSSATFKPGVNGSGTDSSATGFFSQFLKNKKSVKVMGKNERYGKKHSAHRKLCKKSKETNGINTYTTLEHIS